MCKSYSASEIDKKKLKKYIYAKSYLFLLKVVSNNDVRIKHNLLSSILPILFRNHGGWNTVVFQWEKQAAASTAGGYANTFREEITNIMRKKQDFLSLLIQHLHVLFQIIKYIFIFIYILVTDTNKLINAMIEKEDNKNTQKCLDNNSCGTRLHLHSLRWFCSSRSKRCVFLFILAPKVVSDTVIKKEGWAPTQTWTYMEELSSPVHSVFFLNT